MHLPRFFVVLVVLIGRVWLFQITIETDKSHGLVELEDAAIKLLSNCYANEDKTAVLIGDIPGGFIKKLSAQGNFSIVLLDNRRRTNSDMIYWRGENLNKVHNVHILVTMAPYYQTLSESLDTFHESRYRSFITYVMMLGWSPENKYADCNGNYKPITTLITAQVYKFPHAIFICRDIRKGIVIYESSVFTHNAPNLWKLVHSHHSRNLDHRVSYFMREYQENEQMCENLFFKKVHDMDGFAIQTTHVCFGQYNCSEKSEKDHWKNNHAQVEAERQFGVIRDFFTYMNANEKIIWQRILVGQNPIADRFRMLIRPIHMRGLAWNVSFAYPYGVDCKFLITQFRGHKMQVQKIYDVIDIYSWAGMCVTYFISILFFKFFMHQSVIVAVLNHCRLTCNLGLTTSPPNVGTQIYMGCLLFFMVTMQGIFTSSMSSAMTVDVPLHQANTIQDIAELGYKVYVSKEDLIHFADERFKGRLKLLLSHEECIGYIIRDAMSACFAWSDERRAYALSFKLHLSNCIAREYITIITPRFWDFQEEFDSFIGIKKGGDIMMNFDIFVEEKRSIEAELEERFSEPKIMTYTDLGFAFVILGIGWGCAFVSFIVESAIYRFQRKVKTTQITVKSRWEIENR